MATMRITEWVCNSCAAVGIQDLGTRKSAEDAMVYWFKNQMFKAPSIYDTGKKRNYGTPEAHIIFIAGPEAGTSFHVKEWTKYGTEFARYIRDHKLGKCVTAGKVFNAKHHSTTTCQVWVWQPDKAALIEWWEGRIEAKVVDPKTGKLLVNGKPPTIDPDLKCGWCRLPYKEHTKAKTGPRINCPYDRGVWEGPEADE